MAKIGGLDKLLEQLSKVASDKAMMVGVTKSAMRVEAKAKQLCPVDTGLLRASINTTLQPDKLRAIVSTNVKYASYVEFGTEFQDFQPYMYPALQQNKDKIKQDILDALKTEIGGL